MILLKKGLWYDVLNACLLGSEVLVAAQTPKTDIKQILKDKLKDEGPQSTRQYIENLFKRYTWEPVKIAVAGRCNVGKSTFINTMLGIKKGELSRGKSGQGVTTEKEYAYPDYKNDEIIFYDLPGYGSISMNTQSFLKKVPMNDFDYFFLMFDSILLEHDAWFVNQIQTTMTPFCLVRTKLDLNLSKYNEDAGLLIQKIRHSCIQSMANDVVLREAKLFIISSDQPSIGEMTELIEHMTVNISVAKCNAILNYVPSLTNYVVEQIYEDLRKRIKWAAFEASITSRWDMSGLGICFNIAVIKREIERFIEAFHLKSKVVKELPEVNCKWGISNLDQFILTGLESVKDSGSVGWIYMSVAIMPFLNPTLATYKYVSYFLQKNLDEMKKDAVIVYEHTLTKKSTK